MRDTEFVPGEYYHIYNHGVEEREVFTSDFDFKRALVSFVAFNDEKDSPSNLSRFVKNPAQLVNYYTPDKRRRIIDIIAYTILPTHYHIFVREKAEQGISRFMHRFSKGYSRYFNLKDKRDGTLWKSPFQARLIDNEDYFVHIISYIHLNILDLIGLQWREGEIEDWDKAASELSSYPWSSYGYYRKGLDQFGYQSLILSAPDWFSDYYPEPFDFEDKLKDWSSRYTSLSLLGNDN